MILKNSLRSQRAPADKLFFLSYSVPARWSNCVRELAVQLLAVSFQKVGPLEGLHLKHKNMGDPLIISNFD